MGPGLTCGHCLYPSFSGENQTSSTFRSEPHLRFPETGMEKEYSLPLAEWPSLLIHGRDPVCCSHSAFPISNSDGSPQLPPRCLVGNKSVSGRCIGDQLAKMCEAWTGPQGVKDKREGDLSSAQVRTRFLNSFRALFDLVSWKLSQASSLS